MIDRVLELLLKFVPSALIILLRTGWKYFKVRHLPRITRNILLVAIRRTPKRYRLKMYKVVLANLNQTNDELYHFIIAVELLYQVWRVADLAKEDHRE